MTRPRPAVVARQPTEKEWSRTVCEYARLRPPPPHWELYHTWLSVRSQSGWPDLALARPPRLVLAELKRESGKLTPRQEYWTGLLRQIPAIEVYVWRPSDWDEVEEVLR